MWFSVCNSTLVDLWCKKKSHKSIPIICIDVCNAVHVFRRFCPQPRQSINSPIYIIPVHDTRGASAFGISHAYYQIAVSNCTLYLCLGRQTSNDYFTNGQTLYYFVAPGFGETAFVAITEMAIWLIYETVFGSLFKRNYQTWWVSILLWKWACVNGILALQSGEYGPISIIYIYILWK